MPEVVAAAVDPEAAAAEKVGAVTAAEVVVVNVAADVVVVGAAPDVAADASEGVGEAAAAMMSVAANAAGKDGNAGETLIDGDAEDNEIFPSRLAICVFISTIM